MRRLVFLIGILLFLSACGHKRVRVNAPNVPNAPNASPGPQQSPSASSKDLEGLASYYAEPYHGRKTASGEIFDMNSVSAAHATLRVAVIGGSNVGLQHSFEGRELRIGKDPATHVGSLPGHGPTCVNAGVVTLSLVTLILPVASE